MMPDKTWIKKDLDRAGLDREFQIVVGTTGNWNMNRLARYSLDTARKFSELLADERAATAIEYAMIAAGVGAAIAATVFSLGTAVKQSLYDKVSDAFQ
jgi:pilus assembly protein Flp/PilA